MEMVEVKTAELAGPALDWAVAKAEGDDHWTSDRNPDWFAWRMRNWKPSTDWSQGGPLIDEYKVCLVEVDGEWFAAFTPGERLADWNDAGRGDTALIAACRAIVRAKFGGTVSVPAELVRG